jgi:glycosyltransferase involved in cell wall biosynthesis
MRILICNWKDQAHPLAGGAEVWTHGVASAWVRSGHEVTLASSASPDLGPLDENDGVRIERGGDYRFGVHGHARRVYARHDATFDLVVDEINTRPFRAPRWASESKVVAFVHQVAREVWFHETPLPVATIGRFVLEPMWLREYAATPVFTPSVATAQSLSAYGIAHATALPQGSDIAPVPTTLTRKASQPTFAFVGRLSAMKRPLDALRAFAIVQHSVPDARLWILGRGPEEARLRRQAARLPGVEILGHLPPAERDTHLAHAHALVTTSVREGWGLVVSEAAAVGTGAIGYDVPGLDDSIRATGGVLVRPRVADLATAMLRVALDPQSAPRPISTGTVPFADVAERLLERAMVSVHA